MLNRVFLIGRLARDPDLRYTPSGIPVTRFSLAVDRPKRPDGTRGEADFIDIVAWRQRAEFASNYLAKGRQVLVEGRLQVRSFVGQDGVKRRIAEVQADNFAFVGPRPVERGAEAPAEEFPAVSQEPESPQSLEEFGGPMETEPAPEAGDPFSQC